MATTQKSILRKLTMWALPASLMGVGLLAGACSDQFMESRLSDQSTAAMQLAATADAAGNYTAAMDPSASTTQVLKAATGTIAGSAIAMPPGALSIPVSVTIGQGETLASSDMSQQLGMSDNSATAAGPAVSFVPSETVMASSPFTLSIPVSSGSSLMLNDTGSLNRELTVVMYKWMKVENGTTTYEMGMLPPKELTITKSSVQFQTKMFGTFQIATLQQPIRERVKQPTAEPPMLRALAGNPLVGAWAGGCQEEGPGTGGGGGGGGGGGMGMMPNIGNNVGGQCESVNDAGNRVLKFRFNVDSSATGTKGFKIARDNGSFHTGEFDSNLSIGPSTIDAGLPDQSDFLINDSEKIALGAPDGCYFEDSVGSKFSFINYKSPGYFGIAGEGDIQVEVIDNSGPKFYAKGHDLGMNDLVRIIDGSANLGEILQISSYAPETGLFTLAYLGGTSVYPWTASDYGITRTIQLLGNGSSTGSITKFIGDSSASRLMNPALTPMSVALNSAAPMRLVGLYDISVTQFVWPGNNAWTNARFETSYAKLTFDITNSYMKVHDVYDMSTSEITTIYNNNSYYFRSSDKETCRAANHLQLTLKCGPGGPTLPWGGAPPTGPGPNPDSGKSEIGIPPEMKFWRRDQVKFNSNTYMYSSANFTAPNCTGKLISRREETGSYKLGTQAADKTYPVEIKIQTSRVALIEPQAVAYANSKPDLNCGYNDWVVANPRDIYNSPKCGYTNDDEGNLPVGLKIEGNQLNFKNSDGEWDSVPMIKQ